MNKWKLTEREKQILRGALACHSCMDMSSSSTDEEKDAIYKKLESVRETKQRGTGK